MTRGMVLQAVLFDMDGVVADTETSVTAFWTDLAVLHRITLSSDDFYRHVYGLPASHTLDTLFAGLDARERSEALRMMYAREAAGPYEAIPGALELLRTLRGLDIPTALVTSAAPVKVDAVSRALGLEGLLSTIVTADDLHRGKPDPQGYLLAAARLGVDPTCCLVLEDALSGVEAAISAGSLCVGVTVPERAGTLLAAGAVAVVPNLRAISIKSSHGYQMLLAASKTFDLRRSSRQV